MHTDYIEKFIKNKIKRQLWSKLIFSNVNICLHVQNSSYALFFLFNFIILSKIIKNTNASNIKESTQLQNCMTLIQLSVRYCTGQC